MAPKKSRREREHSSSPEYHHRTKKRRHRSRSSSEERDHRHRPHYESSGSEREQRHHRRHSGSDSDDTRHRQRHKKKSSRHDRRDRREDRFQGVRVKREPLDEDERRRNDDRRREARRNRPANPFTADRDSNQTYGGPNVSSQDSGAAPQEKEEPNFALSGKLTEDTNTYRGVVIKYNQPPEARKPRKRWRLYPFKGDEALPMLPVHRHSGYLLGRERLIADVPIDHPSCSKQHAVLQYRLVDYERDDGTMGRQVRPYIIDLGSTNGTYVNNQRIEAQRYVQLMEKDVLKFGYSTREYVLLHEKSDVAEIDDY